MRNDPSFITLTNTLEVKKSFTASTTTTTRNGIKCLMCNEQLCRNCLTHGHFVSWCPKNSFCKKCTLKHSGFLHTPKRPVRADANATAHTAAVPTPDQIFAAPNVHTKPKFPVSKSAIATKDDIKNWVHLEGVNIDTIDANVDLLIGGDLPELHQPYEVKPAMWAIRHTNSSWLGCEWSVDFNCNFIRAEPLEEQFKQLCNIEFNDIPTEKTVMSRNDLQALQMMQESTKLKNGHYQVSMPWKSPPEEFPNNKAVALKRLNLLKSRLIKESTLHTKYTDFMNDLLLKSYAEEALQKDQPRWYLPHHPVLNPQKPEKVRVVFDGSAKYQGVCLNDKLYQGPDLTNTFVGVLLRFRLGPIAFAVDIEKMFYQVKVGETDSHYLSYLWWEDGNLNMNPQEYQMVVHLFGGKSSPSSYFALRKVAKDHADDFDPVVTNVVNNNFYVDDCLKSVDSEETLAIGLAKELKNLLTRGVNLTKWVSNSNQLVSTLTDSEQNASTSLFGGEQQRALGVHWFVKQDALGYVISPKKQPSKAATPRTVFDWMQMGRSYSSRTAD
ncbi:uncharacterized protein [Antedon mediterranea]|uniref:uncharacterized protein n=1 Tax=Antedon mediterranea TaxID=105859 RepID=UPI003AF591A5